MNKYYKFNGKSILIWGYGREGQSTERFLKRCCSPDNVEIFEGKREEIDEGKYDHIIKSPGIPMDDDDPKFTSQTEIFLEAYRDNVVGITGTKGKSTTSSMLFHVLDECLDSRVILLGNIGEPCLDHFEEVESDTAVVFEMSCHQLAHVRVSPHIAVFLNIYEEHLDYYGTFDKYFKAKCNITRFQRADDRFYVGDEVLPIETVANKTVVYRDGVPHYELQILGGHNEYNADFVYRIAAEVYGVKGEAVRESLKSFKGLPHRLQYCGEKDGIRFYNDSISTIPGATIEALKAVPGAYTVLIGGMDRGICYDELVSFIQDHPEFYYIFSYDSGKRIFESVGEGSNRAYVPELKEAVDHARRVTPEGRACILSPASASYGYFKNFEERGDIFTDYAMNG